MEKIGQLLSGFWSNPIIRFEIIALIFSFFSFHPRNVKSLRIFPIILGIIILGEIFGTIVFNHYRENNVFVYNLFEIIYISLYLIAFKKFLNSDLSIIKFDILIIFYIIFSTANFFFIQRKDQLNSYSTYLASITLIVYISLLLYKYSVVDFEINLKREPGFWISAAFLISYIPTSIFFAAYDFIVIDEINAKLFSEVYIFSSSIINGIHYLLLSYGFICHILPRAY